jgi:hypothetical protein
VGRSTASDVTGKAFHLIPRQEEFKKNEILLAKNGDGKCLKN